MKLSIIIPVFNEEKTVDQVLENVCNLSIPYVTKEIIIVDDGSTDNTAQKITTFLKKNRNVQFIKHKENKGKGAAVKTGIDKATGEYIVIQDADLEYDPKDIRLLVSKVINGKAEVVFGTRLKRLPDFSRDERNSRFFIQYLGNKFLSLVTSILYGQWITDMETCYKLFPKAATTSMRLCAKRFDFEPEITAKLLKKGYKIYEIPISTNPRSEKEGKKLNAFRDGPVALWTLLKFRF